MRFSTLLSGAACASLAYGAVIPRSDALPTELTSSDAAPTDTEPAHSSDVDKSGYDWSTVGEGTWSKLCGFISQAYAQLVIKQFTTDMIIPDLIEGNVFWNPTVKVNVAYGDKAVNLGTYFKTMETLTQPTLNFTAEKDYDPYKTKYTYFLVDPDVPQDGSPVQVNYLHWMVVDAQPFCVKDQQPKTYVGYQPLTPLSTTQHRYTFLVYRQPEGKTPPNDPALQLRTPFDLNDYAQDNNLKVVGGNFLKEAITNGVVE